MFGIIEKLIKFLKSDPSAYMFIPKFSTVDEYFKAVLDPEN